MNWQKLRELDQRGLLFVKSKRVDMAWTKNGYVVDRRIFKWPWLVFVIFVLSVTYVEGWTLQELVFQGYVECSEYGVSSTCENPFYRGCDFPSPLCDEVNDLEVLQVGRGYGTVPSPYIGFAWPLFFLTLGLGLWWNHVKYNRGKRPFDLEDE